MRTSWLIAASALALCACQGKAPQRAALDCPQAQGKLVRVSQAADGGACAYRGENGAEVELRLVAVQGDVDATLKTIEDSLLPAPTEAEQVAALAAADAGADRFGASGDAVDINLPGLRILARDDKADIKVGGVSVSAGGDSAVVRTRNDVRLKGEALSREKRGVRASYLRASDELPGGWRYVGYEAAGPKTGPLAVATVRSKSSPRAAAGVNDGDLKRLARRNGGV